MKKINYEYVKHIEKELELVKEHIDSIKADAIYSKDIATEDCQNGERRERDFESFVKRLDAIKHQLILATEDWSDVTY